jgi:hypothetical protein
VQLDGVKGQLPANIPDLTDVLINENTGQERPLRKMLKKFQTFQVRYITG